MCMSGGSRSTEARRFRNALPRSRSILKARKLEQGTGGSHVPARQIQEHLGKETGGSWNSCVADVQVRAGAYTRTAAAGWRGWFEKYQGCKLIRTWWLSTGDEGVTESKMIS